MILQCRNRRAIKAYLLVIENEVKLTNVAKVLIKALHKSLDPL